MLCRPTQPATIWGMGTLFEDSDDYPTYFEMPRVTMRVSGGKLIITGCLAASLHGVVSHEEHAHVPHQDHTPISVRLDAISVSSTSGSGNHVFGIPPGRVTFR